jgi:gas vesicle protein GvpA/GvpJ/GvpM family
MSAERERLPTQREVALVEVLDRALGAGVVITGDITLSLADIDLVYLSLRLVVGSVPTLRGELPEEADAESLTLAAASGDSR